MVLLLAAQACAPAPSGVVILPLTAPILPKTSIPERLHPELQLVDVPWPSERFRGATSEGAAAEPVPEVATLPTEPLPVPAPLGSQTDLAHVSSPDGRYQAFVDERSATLVVRDLRTRAVHALVDRQLTSGATIVAVGECVSLVIGSFTHMTACIEPFRVVDLHMEGR